MWFEKIDLDQAITKQVYGNNFCQSQLKHSKILFSIYRFVCAFTILSGQQTTSREMTAVVAVRHQ